MTVADLYAALDLRFPSLFSADFDLDGLQLCPDKTREVNRIVTALDVTEDSVRFAIDSDADVLLTHHPILFSPVRTLDPDSSLDAKNATALLKNGIAHISLHTRFDAADGGINDTLCELLSLTDTSGFGADTEVKKLGRFGNTFSQSPEDFAAFVARKLNTHVELIDGGYPVEKIAVVGGSAGDYLELFLESDADLLVTGELSHHRLLAAAECKKSVVLAGHYGTEICFCQAIRYVLEEVSPECEICAFPHTAHTSCFLP